MNHLSHPLSFLPSELRQPIFWCFFALTMAGFAVFQLFLDPPLKTPVSTGNVPAAQQGEKVPEAQRSGKVPEAQRSGIVAFELARTPEASTAMVASWDARARLFAAFGLGFDFLFMPVYATALSAGLLLTVGKLRGVWAGLAKLLGWGAYLAMLFDAIENLALFSILNGNVGANPAVAFWCASLKFGLLLLGLVYSLAGWLFPKK